MGVWPKGGMLLNPTHIKSNYAGRSIVQSTYTYTFLQLFQICQLDWFLHTTLMTRMFFIKSAWKCCSPFYVYVLIHSFLAGGCLS